MVEETITTSVDALTELLKKHNKIGLEEAAKKLDIPISVVQSWVDFLVEEKILGLEYKFTTPYIYLNKSNKKKSSYTIKKDDVSIDNFRENFEKKAEEKQISGNKAKDLWKNHLLQKVDKKKDFFFREARKRGFFNTEDLWKEYKKRVVNT